jgi:hypothetical protein
VARGGRETRGGEWRGKGAREGVDGQRGGVDPSTEGHGGRRGGFSPRARAGPAGIGSTPSIRHDRATLTADIATPRTRTHLSPETHAHSSPADDAALAREVAARLGAQGPFVRELQAQLAGDTALCLVGAGASIAASGGAPAASWAGLLADGVARCVRVARPRPDAHWREEQDARIRSADTRQMLAAAEQIAERLGGPEGAEFCRWLRDTAGALALRDARLPRAIAALGAPIATTNYDDLLERVTGERAVIDLGEIERALLGGARGIVHLHGHWTRPETLLFGQASYDAALRDARRRAVLAAMRRRKTLLFMGYGAGLDDPTLATLLRWGADVFAAAGCKHYCLLSDEDVSAAPRADAKPRLVALSCGPTRAHLVPFLEALAAAVRPATR